MVKKPVLCQREEEEMVFCFARDSLCIIGQCQWFTCNLAVHHFCNVVYVACIVLLLKKN